MSYKRVSVSVQQDDLDWAKRQYVSISKVLQDALHKLREGVKHESEDTEKSD